MSVIPKGAHQGHVLVWGYAEYFGSGQGQQRALQYAIVDPENLVFWNFTTCLAPDLGDLFCAGHAWNANGDLVVVGGTSTHGPHHINLQWGGARLLYVWEPPVALGTSGTWNPGPPLDAERWYPSVLMLSPDLNAIEDKMAVLGGTHFGTDVNSYQVWRSVVSNPVGAWDSAGSNNTFGGPGSPQPSSLGEYPRAHSLTSRAFFVAGYPADCMSTNHFVTPRTWSGPWNIAYTRVYGSSVLFPISPGGGMQDTVVAMGGLTQLAVPPAGTVLSDGRAWTPGSGWAPVPALVLNYPRWLFNTVLLPDSTILAVGGEQQFRHLRCSEVPAFVPELFKAGAWRKMAANNIIRDYHSTAVLLPSGKVLTGGGESRNYAAWLDCLNQTLRVPTVAFADYQVFLPPYLNCGVAQPTIQGQATTLPNNYWTWLYGAQQDLTHSTLPIGVSIAKVVLLRVGSVTHHADINQRCVELPFVVLPTPPSTVRVAVPSKASQLLPRGFYMAFVVTNQGVPSKAAFVRIQ